MDIKSCPVCWGTNLDATKVGDGHKTAICYDCGYVFEVKGVDTLDVVSNIGGEPDGKR